MGRGSTTTLQQAQRSDLPYAPLCEDRLYLRNAVAGTYTHLERVTNFLRDHVWGGERIVGFVKQEFFADAFIETGDAGVALYAGSADGLGGSASRADRAMRLTDRP